MNEKVKLNIKIEELLLIKKELLELDQNNIRVKENIELINQQLLDYQLELINANSKITFKNKFINRFLKSKTVLINLILIVLEILNKTDALKLLNIQDEKLLSNIVIIIAMLTIYLRVQQKDNE